MTDLKLRVLFDFIDHATKPLKTIRQSHRQLAQSFKVSHDRLKAFNRTQKDVAAFRALRENMRETATALHTAQQRMKVLSERIHATDAPTQAMTRKFTQTSAAVTQLSAHYQAQGSQLKALQGRLSTAGIQTGRLGEQEQRLRRDIAATNSAITTQQAHLTTLAAREKRLAEARTRMHTLQSRSTHLAVGGYATRATGLHALTMIGHTTDEAKHYQTERQRLQALGLGEQASQEAMKFAAAMQTVGTSATENLTLVRDAMTVFADVHHAKIVAPTLAKMKFANEALYGGEDAAANEARFLDLLKVIELRGGLASQERFRQEAERVQRVLTATGGRVGPEEWRHVIQTGGVAAKQMRRDAFYYQLEPLIQEMGGHAVGTGLMSAYSNLYQGNTTVRAAKELQRLRLIDPNKVEYNTIGMLKRFKPGALKGGDLFKQSPLEWLEQVLLPALAKKDLTHPDQIKDTLATILTNRTASNLFTTMYLQRAQIHKSEALNTHAGGIETLYESAKNTTHGQEIAALAKLHDLKLALGEKVLPLYSRALQWVAQATERLTRWLQYHQQAAQKLIGVLTALAAVLAVVGTLTIALVAVLGPLAVLKFSLTTLGIQGGRLIPMLQGVGGALVWLGRLALAHPLIAVISALALGAGLIWRHWDTLGPKFTALWETIQQGASQTFDGLAAQAHRLLEGLNRLKQRLIEGGASLMLGLASGIRSALSCVKQAILDVADRVKGWFQDTLGLQHPLQRGAQFGRFIAPGTAGGSHREPPRVALAAITSFAPRIDTRRALTAYSMVPVQMSGDTINITFQAAPGMDAAAIARAVQATLDQRERDKRARFASRFTDH